MATVAASALVLLLAGAGEPRLDVGLRAEERTRSFEQAVTSGSGASGASSAWA